MEFHITVEREKQLLAIFSKEKNAVAEEFAKDNLAAREKHGTFNVDQAVALSAMRRAYHLGCNDCY